MVTRSAGDWLIRRRRRPVLEKAAVRPTLLARRAEAALEIKFFQAASSWLLKRPTKHLA